MQSLTNKKVLVTGAGGFIGSHLSSHLIHLGADVTAMLHYNSRSDYSNLDFLPEDEKKVLNIVRGNVEDPSFVDRHIKGKEIVFHLAALIGIPYSYEAPLSYVRTNIEGTVNVLEAVRKFDVDCLVHTSTSETYGTALYTPIDEKHPLQGQSPYSATKIAADKLAESYFRSFEVPVVTVRPFNTYGPRQSARAVIPTIISQLLTKDELCLGDLRPVRDFNFVDDTVRGFIAAAMKPEALGKVINVGHGKGTTIGDLVSVLMEIMAVDKPIVTDQKRFRPKDSEVFELICDNALAKELINWSPMVSLREGLGYCVDFVEKNLNFYNSGKYEV
ncbi:MAG: GDP-mannose 4,6-dehydratase [Desulfobulbaceae bacterium]|nr:GDP-mannose 4,6-dehydratase [Desulfobulbaceae bacterium]